MGGGLLGTLLRRDKPFDIWDFLLLIPTVLGALGTTCGTGMLAYNGIMFGKSRGYERRLAQLDAIMEKLKPAESCSTSDADSEPAATSEPDADAPQLDIV